jgi:hypothetical protein
MLWKTVPAGDMYEVYKLDKEGNVTGDAVGSYKTIEEADGRVEKFNKSVDFYSWTAISFAELESEREAAEIVDEASRLASQFHMLVDNIMWDEDSEDKSEAVRQLANEFSSLLSSATNQSPTKSNSILGKAVDAVVGAFSHKEQGNRGMFIWKDEGDTYRWLARYSNKFRDNDHPPEIISSKSHQKFTALVDAGVVEPPDLWLWHIPQYHVGKADWVTYDDVGFAYAGGSFYTEYNDVAKSLSQVSELGVSHGMPRWSIQRDEGDNSIITQHITEEISPLPLSAAANKMADFVVLNKETNMAIPKEKRDTLINDWKIDPVLLDVLESQSLKDAASATNSGVESKDLTDVDGTETGVTEIVTDVVATTDEEVETEDQATEVVEAEVVKMPPEMASAIEATMKMVTLLGAKVDALSNEIKSIKVTDEEKIAEKAARTPLASLTALMTESVIGKERASVDGRTVLANDSPKETAPPAHSITGLPMIDGWMTAGKSA